VRVASPFLRRSCQRQFIIRNNEEQTDIYILLIFFVSCKGQSLLQNIQGNYTKSLKDYSYSLILNTDSSFTLTQKYFEVISNCKGKWQLKLKDTILLKCFDENLSPQLSSGYMAERQRQVIDFHSYGMIRI